MELNYFRQQVLLDPRSFCQLLDYVCGLLLGLSVEKLDISGERINKRLQHVLVSLRRTIGPQQATADTKKHSVTQRELSEFLGVAEETISRELKKMTKRSKGLKQHTSEYDRPRQKRMNSCLVAV